MRWGMFAAAAIVLALGLAARAEEGQERREEERETTARREGEPPEPEARERARREEREAAERRERENDRDATRYGRRREPGGPQAPPRARRDGDEFGGPPPERRGRGRGPMPGDMGAMPDGAMSGGAMIPGMHGGAMPMGPVPGMPGMHGMPGPDMERMRETDPEMFELEQADRQLDRESHELAEQFRRSKDDPARAGTREKLQDVVGRHFKVRQERRELEVKRLQAQLERLRGTLEKRAKESGALIDRRMAELLGEPDFGF